MRPSRRTDSHRCERPLRMVRPAHRLGDSIGRSPGSRVSASCVRPSRLPSGHLGRRLCAYSCGGSRGMAETVGVPRSLFPSRRDPGNRYAESISAFAARSQEVRERMRERMTFGRHTTMKCYGARSRTRTGTVLADLRILSRFRGPARSMGYGREARKIVIPVYSGIPEYPAVPVPGVPKLSQAKHSDSIRRAAAIGRNPTAPTVLKWRYPRDDRHAPHLSQHGPSDREHPLPVRQLFGNAWRPMVSRTTSQIDWSPPLRELRSAGHIPKSVALWTLLAHADATLASNPAPLLRIVSTNPIIARTKQETSARRQPCDLIHR